MPDSRFSLPNMFGKYSLPSVMGRLGHRIGGWFHHDGGGEPGNFPISQVGGLTQQPFSTYNDYGTSGFTDPNIDSGNPFTPQAPQGNPFGNPGSTFTGNSSGGTLGGGTAIDPSQWGNLGFGADNVGDTTRYYNQFGRPGEGTGFGGNGLLGSGFFQHHQATGGINPGGMYTGGNAQAHPLGMGTGGALPPQGLPALMGGNLPPHGMT